MGAKEGVRRDRERLSCERVCLPSSVQHPIDGVVADGHPFIGERLGDGAGGLTLPRHLRNPLLERTKVLPSLQRTIVSHNTIYRVLDGRRKTDAVLGR